VSGATPMQRVVMAVVDWAWRHAALVALLGLGVAAGAGYYAVTHFAITTDRKAMLDEDLPFRQAFRDYQQAFPNLPDTLIVVIDAETPRAARELARDYADRVAADDERYLSVSLGRDDPFFERHQWLYLPQADAAAVVDQVDHAAPSMAYVARDPTPGGLFELIYRRMRAGSGGDREALAPLFGGLLDGLRATLGGDGAQVSWSAMATPQALQQRARARDSGPGRALLQVEPRLDYGRLFAARPAIDGLREIGRDLGIADHPGRQLRITGGLAMAQEELQTVASGMELISILVFVMVSLILLLALRSLRMVLAVAISLIVGLVMTGGWALFAVGHLNMVSVVFGVLYLGLGVDYAIHLCMRYRELLVDAGERRHALVSAAGDVGGSLVVCAITTALGFFAFIPTEYTGVSELGLISGTGMLISLVVSLTVLPALLRLLSPRAGSVDRLHLEDRIQRAVTASLIRQRLLVLAVFAFIGGVALMMARGVEFDANVLNLRDPESESVATFEELLRTSEVPPWTITVLAADRSSARARAEEFERLAEVARAVHVGDFLPDEQETRLRQRDDVRGLIEPALESWGRRPPPGLAEQVESARDLHWLLGKALDRGAERKELRDLHDVLEDLIARSERATDDQRASLWRHLHQTLFADFDGTIARLDDLVDVERMTVDDLPPGLRSRWIGVDGSHRVEVIPAEQLDGDWAAMERFVTAVTGRDASATGGPVQMVASGAAIAEAFRQALMLAGVAALVVLVVLLRRPLDVLLVLLPLGLAGVVTVAAMVVVGMSFNFANVIALPLLLGIGVDNGIHMVHRARHHGVDGTHALGTSTARAVLFSSLTTACSFGNLALSQHPGTASMGLLLFIGIIASLVATLLVLPALLAACGLGVAVDVQRAAEPAP